MSTRPRSRRGLPKKVWFAGVGVLGLVGVALVAAYIVVSAGDDPNLATAAPDLPTPAASRTQAPPTATAVAAVATPTTASAAAAATAPPAPPANTPTPPAPPTPQPTPVPAGPVEGKFVIDTSQSSSKFVITRTVLGSTASVVATGSGVTGQFFVSANGLGSGGTSSFQLDMRTVSSSDSLTNNFLRSGEIDTVNYPYAQFVAASTTPFSPGYGTGNQFSFSLSGSLTLNGVTRPVTFQVLAKQSGEFFSATGDADILLSQFDVTVPDTIFGGARDQVHIQVLLVAQS